MSNPCLAYDNKRNGIIIFQNKIDYILWTKKHRKWETIFVGMMMSVTIYSGSVLTSSHVMTPISIEIRSYQIFYLILLNFLTICFKRNFRYGILVWELTIEIIRVNKERIIAMWWSRCLLMSAVQVLIWPWHQSRALQSSENISDCNKMSGS